MHSKRTFQVWGKSKLACSYVQANHASSAKILRSPALSTGQAIGASLLSLAHCGGLWDYPRALKAGLLTPYSNRPRPAGQSQPVYTLSCSLGLQAHGPLGGRLFTTPLCFWLVSTHSCCRQSTTRVCKFLIAHCTPPPPPPPHQLAPVSQQHPATAAQIQLAPRPYGIDTRFEPPISVAHSEIPRQAQDTVEENPTASRTTTTDTHTAAISSTPTPTHISHIGSDDILTVLLGGAFLALTLPGILKHVLVSNG
ncbi:hypothetical protein BASA83_013169 [Batrachochytrium salamandrivorans]|nr:hypothetical protein BASA83_013169 [Batrachochytrium salamandrivorans]